MLTKTMQRGMSIVELMVTLLIIGMLMALVGPSAAVWIQNSQLRNAADGVAVGIQQAKMEALKRNKLVMFQLTDPNSTAWRVCLYDPATDACSVAPNSILSSRSASEGSPNARVATVNIANPNPLTALPPGSGVGTGSGSVTFDSFGRMAPTAGYNLTMVDVRNPSMNTADERRLVILVTVGGQIRMCDPKLNKATNPQGCV